MKRADIRDVVDRFLVSKKVMAGTASWQPEHDDKAVRWVVGLLAAGELSEFRLIVKAYPLSKDLKFRLILSQVKAIWRLDFAHDIPHLNSLNKPNDLSLGPVSGSHFHSWIDNRRLSTVGFLPDELHNARELPGNIQTFENAFRWFCGQTSIIGIDEFGIPVLPRTDRLL